MAVSTTSKPGSLPVDRWLANSASARAAVSAVVLMVIVISSSGWRSWLLDDRDPGNSSLNLGRGYDIFCRPAEVHLDAVQDALQTELEGACGVVRGLVLSTGR